MVIGDAPDAQVDVGQTSITAPAARTRPIAYSWRARTSARRASS
jgi:hypothetical protein